MTSKTKIIGALAALAAAVSIGLYISKKNKAPTDFGSSETKTSELDQKAKNLDDLANPFDDDDLETKGMSEAEIAAKRSAELATIPDEPKRREEAIELLDLTGVNRRLNGYEENLRNQFEALSKNGEISPLEVEKFIDIFRKSLKPEKILQKFQDELVKAFTPEDLEEIKGKISANPTYQKLMAFEESMSDPQAMESFQAEFSKYMESPGGKISKDREDMIRKYDSTTGTSALVSDMIMEMSQQMAAQAGEANPAASDPKQLEQIKAETTKMIQDGMVQSYSYIMKDLKDGEIKNLVSLSEDPKIKKYQDISLKVMKKPMNKTISRAGKLVGEMMLQQDQPQ